MSGQAIVADKKML